MAALASVQRVGLCSAPFLAFHVSGGTTDLLLVTPDDKKILSIAQLATSLDLKAGQAVDRVGGMLGLAFPAGRALDALSLQAPEQRFGHRPVLKEGSCCLSGIENICRTMMGCIAAGAGQDIVDRAEEYAGSVGLAFQIVDDILDVTADQAALGKPTGSDKENDKTTYITLFGIEKSREIVRDLVKKSYAAIGGTVLDDPFLYDLAEMLAVREY